MFNIYFIVVTVLAVIQGFCVLYVFDLYKKEQKAHEETKKNLNDSFNTVVKHCEDMAVVYRKAKAYSERVIFEEDKKLLDKIDKQTLTYYYKKK